MKFKMCLLLVLDLANQHHTFAKDDFKCDPYSELNEEVKVLFLEYFNANLTYVCSFTKIAHAISEAWPMKTRIWNVIYDVYIIQVTEQVFTNKSLAHAIYALAASKKTWFMNQDLLYGCSADYIIYKYSRERFPVGVWGMQATCILSRNPEIDLSEVIKKPTKGELTEPQQHAAYNAHNLVMFDSNRVQLRFCSGTGKPKSTECL